MKRKHKKKKIPFLFCDFSPSHFQFSTFLFSIFLFFTIFLFFPFPLFPVCEQKFPGEKCLEELCSLPPGCYATAFSATNVTFHNSLLPNENTNFNYIAEIFIQFTFIWKLSLKHLHWINVHRRERCVIYWRQFMEIKNTVLSALRGTTHYFWEIIFWSTDF